MPKYISDLIPPVILAVIVLAGLGVIFAVANASSPPVPCTLSPCSLSLNISWDTAGKPDTRPGTWGNTDSVSSEIPFVNVPAGYLVAVTHVSGDEIAAPHGAMAPNGMAYALVGLTSTTPYQSPYVGPGLGSEGTFLYKQTPISQGGARIPINENVIGTLNADNIAVVKQAMFLDTAGASLHLEATLVLQFEYIKQ